MECSEFLPGFPELVENLSNANARRRCCDDAASGSVRLAVLDTVAAQKGYYQLFARHGFCLISDNSWRNRYRLNYLAVQRSLMDRFSMTGLSIVFGRVARRERPALLKTILDFPKLPKTELLLRFTEELIFANKVSHSFASLIADSTPYA